MSKLARENVVLRERAETAEIHNLDLCIANRDLAAENAAALREVAELRAELTNQRDYTAAVACGIEHLPHDHGEPCLRCERDDLRARLEDARVILDKIVKCRACADEWLGVSHPAPAAPRVGICSRHPGQAQCCHCSEPCGEWPNCEANAPATAAPACPVCGDGPPKPYCSRAHGRPVGEAAPARVQAGIPPSVLCPHCGKIVFGVSEPEAAPERVCDGSGVLPWARETAEGWTFNCAGCPACRGGRG